MKRIVTVSAGIIMLLWGVTGGLAQTATPSSSGAFTSLSPGNQKIASALYQAQSRPTSPTSPTPLTRDQLAQMKQSGKGWGEIFQSMKAQGLVSAKNLGQVVSRYNHTHHLSSSGTITTASGRTESLAAVGSGAATHGHSEVGVEHGQSGGGFSHGNEGSVSHGGASIGHASSHGR